MSYTIFSDHPQFNINIFFYFAVLVLYDVDKAAENIQHLIKWIMDCYSDSCKLILCCEDDADIFESVKSRCKVVSVEAPPSHQVINHTHVCTHWKGYLHETLSWFGNVVWNSPVVWKLHRNLRGLLNKILHFFQKWVNDFNNFFYFSLRLSRYGLKIPVSGKIR